MKRSTTPADFDGDGLLDVATANLESSDASVLLGNGDGSFTPLAMALHAENRVSVALNACQ